MRPVRVLIALPVAVLATLAVCLPAIAQAAAGWPEYQQGPGRAGFATAAPAAPYRAAWQAKTGIGDSTHVAGLPAPVIEGDDAIVVGRQDVTAIDITSGATAWTVARELGPSAPAAVVPGSGVGGLILYPEGGGDESSSATASASPAAAASASAVSTACRTTTPASPGEPRLVAIDADTRKVAWRVPLPGVSRTGAVVDGGIAAVGTDGGSVLAVDPSSGKVLWTKDVGDCIDVPLAAANGTVFVAVRSVQRQAPQIVALRESDGSAVWSQPYIPRTSGSAAGAPSVANGTLYVALSDATVRAVDAATGGERWAARLNAFVGGAPPVIVGDAVVIADTRGQVYRLDAATGARVWDFALNTPVIGAAAVAVGTVLVPTSDGDVVAFDLASGRETGRVGLGEGAGLAMALSSQTIVLSRTGPTAGLVGLVHDPNGSLTAIESPTVLKPPFLLGAWALAAIPIAALLLLAGRALQARLGPVGPIGSAAEEDWNPDDPGLDGVGGDTGTDAGEGDA